MIDYRNQDSAYSLRHAVLPDQSAHIWHPENAIPLLSLRKSVTQKPGTMILINQTVFLKEEVQNT